MEGDVKTMLDIINTTGFPIACCLALFWLVNKTLKTQQEILVELRSAIQNNTRAVDDISRRIEGLK